MREMNRSTLGSTIRALRIANVYEEDRRQAYEAGMNAFIEKPVSIDRLHATLQELLPWQKNM